MTDDRKWYPYFRQLDELHEDSGYPLFEYGYMDGLGSRLVVGKCDVVCIKCEVRLEHKGSGEVKVFNGAKSFVWTYCGSDAELEEGELEFTLRTK